MPWPPLILSLYRVLSAFNLNLDLVRATMGGVAPQRRRCHTRHPRPPSALLCSAQAAPECAIKSISFTAKWIFVETMPLMAFVIFGATYAAHYAYKRLCTTRRGPALHSHLPALISVSIVMFRTLYLYLTKTTFDVFNCTPTKPPDGNTYMSGNLSVPCGVPGGLQMSLVGPAVIALLVYVLGIPAFVFLFLRGKRERIKYSQVSSAVCRGWQHSHITPGPPPADPARQGPAHGPPRAPLLRVERDLVATVLLLQSVPASQGGACPLLPPYGPPPLRSPGQVVLALRDPLAQDAHRVHEPHVPRRGQVGGRPAAAAVC